LFVVGFGKEAGIGGTVVVVGTAYAFDGGVVTGGGVEECVVAAGVKPVNVPNGVMISMVKLIHAVSNHRNDVFHAELLHIFLVTLRNIVRIQGYYGNETIHWGKLEECFSGVIHDLGALHTRLYFVAERFPEEALHPHIFDTPESDKP